MPPAAALPRGVGLADGSVDMGYDPCAPHVPAPVAVKVTHVPRHYPLHRLVGRRVAHWHGVGTARDACPKTAIAVLPQRVVRALDPLLAPGVLTVAAMGVVGATAFGRTTIMPSPPVFGTVPGVGKQIGTTVSGTTSPPAGAGNPGTNVPEPSTAAILAGAMAVVLISSWIQGGRALRAPPQSNIIAQPLPSRPNPAVHGEKPPRPSRPRSSGPIVP